MTSYMYSPSKKITEFLSEYLEFDPEQLQLGIWSGHLALTNVNLKQDAIYPLLNKSLNRMSSSTTDPKYAKPPLRFKLVSGTIGTFNMKIPWKRLVWGQGDVRASLRNAVIVIAMESQEETAERQENSKEDLFADEHEEPDEEKDDFDPLSGQSKFRERKQRRIQEAERRHLQGLPLASWLNAMNKKDEEEKTKAIVAKESPLKSTGRLDKFLKNSTNDFFWRFYAGLQCDIENVKIVMIQDGVEIGFVLPSMKIFAGHQGTRISVHTPDADDMSNETDVVASPPENVVYEGAYDDGEHVDKYVKFLGIGFYVRTTRWKEQSNSSFVPMDVSSFQYVLRPLDVDFSFSLFYPFSPEKRKKKLEKKEKRELDQPATAQTESAGDASTASSKKRRGKREKQPQQESREMEETTTATTELLSTPSGQSPASLYPHHRRSLTPASFSGLRPLGHVRRATSISGGLSNTTPGKRRRQSLIAPLPASKAATQLAKPQHLKRSTTTSLPLALPEDSIYHEQGIDGEIRAQFDGNVKIGAIEFVCSTRQFTLFNTFLSSAARLRNGRPRKTIRSVLDQERIMRRSLTVMAPQGSHSGRSAEESPEVSKADETKSTSPVENGPITLRLELHSAQTERSSVIRSWWFYVLGVVEWQIRQRKKLRKRFQEKYLFFNWQRQKYKRFEYVRLYIKVQLGMREAFHSWPSSPSSSKSELLAIEDELPIEQILLYRNLARAVHLRGGTKMPDSILDLRGEQGSSSQFQHQPHESPQRTPVPSGSSTVESKTEEESLSLLGVVRKSCSSARKRRNAKHGDTLPAYKPHVPWSKLDRRVDSVSFDESSWARTAKTTKTKSAGQSSEDASVAISFSILTEKLEFLLVETEGFYDVGDEQYEDPRAWGTSAVSRDDMSDVSVLTDDQRFWENEGETLDPEESIADPIASSTDFLLFQMPEKALLRMVVTPFSGSMRSGASRTFNVTIGQVDICGENGSSLLSMGTSTGETPVSEIEIAQVLTHTSGAEHTKPFNALSLSVRVEEEQNILQIDTSSVKSCVDTQTLKELYSVFKDTAALYPAGVLPRSAREDVRLYILRQNAPPTFYGLNNASIRIHGVEVYLAATKELSSETAASKACLRSDIIEIYSGGAFDDLPDMSAKDDLRSLMSKAGTQTARARRRMASFEEGATSGGETRQLKMLDRKLFTSKGSVLAERCLLTANGLNFLVGNVPVFDSPVEVEILGTANAYSVTDVNRARVELVVEVSPIDLLLSKDRIALLSQVIPTEGGVFPLGKRPKEESRLLPPRVEVLSRFLLYTVDLSVRRIRLSLVPDEKTSAPQTMVSTTGVMEEAIVSLLSVVSSFDLSSLPEEAISSALQICIDRLAAVGLHPDESWEAANFALLNFLSDMAELSEAESEAEAQPMASRRFDVLKHRSFESDDLVQTTVRKSAKRVVSMYASQLEKNSVSNEAIQYDAVFDIPDGVSCSLVKLFYDYHVTLNVPTAFVANSSGIHFLRITPAENDENIQDDRQETRSDEVANESPSYESGSERPFKRSGIVFRVFELDQGYPFGKGGLPLSVLGTDVEVDQATEPRTRERLGDLEMGEVDLLFSGQLIKDNIDEVSGVFSPLTGHTNEKAEQRTAEACNTGESPMTTEKRTAGTGISESVDSHFLTALVSVSVLVASDDLVPFSRLTLTDAVSRRPSKPDSVASLSSSSMWLLDLTPGGELYQAPISSLFSPQDLPLCVSWTGSEVHVDLKGARVFLLGRFVNELMQFRKNLSQLFRLGQTENATRPVPTKSVHCSVKIENCELFLPRSSTSTEMLLIDIKSASIQKLDEESFVLPTEEMPLRLAGAEVESWRLMIQLEQFHLFASVMGQDDNSDGSEIESAPWTKEDLMREEGSLDIYVDYAPHLRLLICDHKSSASRLELDMLLSQFCLLLSVWYENMQELPSMFPYSAGQLGSIARHSSVPEFGTEECRSVLNDFSAVNSEIAVVLSHMSLRLSDKNSREATEVAFYSPVVHVLTDSEGITRIGAGSASASLIDNEDEIVSLGDASAQTSRSWADLQFGLEQSGIADMLPQKFQFSAFLTPDWSIYNLGMEKPRLTLSDFSPILKFIDFVGVYFSDPSYGNPSFEVAERISLIKKELLAGAPVQGQLSPVIDFQLWLVQPSICVPCDSGTNSGTCLPDQPRLRVASDTGIWYRYWSIDTISSHESVASDMSLTYIDITLVEQRLIEGLSFGVRYEFNTGTNHTDVSVQVPFHHAGACSIASSRIRLQPSILPPATICSPFCQPDRFLGVKVCELTPVIEVLPAASAALLDLFMAPSSTPELSTSGRMQSEESENRSFRDESPGSTLSLVARAGDFRMFVLDPTLGPHLPVAVLSVASLSVTASQFADANEEIKIVGGESPPEDFQIHVEGHLWADYFKLGLTRSWEPLLEAYKFRMVYEKSRFRGSGLSLQSDSPLHVNITEALLVILDDVIDSSSRLIKDTFGLRESPDDTECIASKSYAKDRIAFSLTNATGTQIEIYQSSENGFVDHLGQGQSTKLSFNPSISMVKNMSVVEVAYPGLDCQLQMYRAKEMEDPAVDVQLPGFEWLQDIKVDTFGRSFAEIVPRAKLSLQKITSDWRLMNVMKLLVEVGLEHGGRQVTIRSICSVVNRTAHTIRLSLHPDPTHEPGCVSETTETPNDFVSDAVVEPGETHQVPTLLMEKALLQAGSHLGSFWLRPDVGSSCDIALESFVSGRSGDTAGLTVEFSSRPVQIAKVVSESALMFEHGHGRDIGSSDAKSSIHVSCPVVADNGDRLAPFCYALEVGRSPVVKARVEEGGRKKHGVKIHGPVAYTFSIHPPFVIVNLLPKRGRFELMHAVRRNVLWFGDLDPGQKIAIHSVGLDAPLLLFLNLGFCRTPVGEGALVHHGSDPPPGARENLSGLRSIGKAGKAVTKQLGKTLTSLSESPDRRGHNKVFLAQNPQFLSNNQRNMDTRRQMTPQGNLDLGLDNGVSGTQKVDGKTYKVDSVTFFPQDVDDEATVIDSVGQRLTLNIENIQGGGGQRRISVFCPFWIVNTTEHALRYKQEGSKSFVSGTVFPTKDGSAALSGGRSHEKYEKVTDTELFRPERKRGTIFSGTPGALATSPGRCELAPDEIGRLIDANLSLEELALLAFMFNFHEGLMYRGNLRLCVQLSHQQRYLSDWSRGLSLDSVGISQIVSIHCKNGRALELSAVISVAPGFLSGYTKIVRLLPRYVVVNRLPCPVRVWQDSSIFRPISADAEALGTEPSTGSSRRWLVLPKKSAQDRGSKVNQYEALWGHRAVLDERVASKDDQSVSHQIPSGTTAHQSALYVTTVAPSELVPFTLPDSRGDRQLRIGLGFPWNLTASFSADVPGEHSLKITRAVNLRLLEHVSTRASPQYEVILPPSDESSFTGELGVWFETEWGTGRSLIVKAVKKNGFAFNLTDVHVGDELLFIDDVPVSRRTFAEAMNILRKRLREVRPNGGRLNAGSGRMSSLRFVGKSRSELSLSEEVSWPLVLTFRTVEERLRRVRLKAARKVTSGSNPLRRTSVDQQNEADWRHRFEYLRAELRTLHHSMFLVLQEEPLIPYEIQNRTINHTIYYRQKGCNGHPWQCLKPGMSLGYAWEEPMKPKRLSVRVATESAFRFAESQEDEVDGGRAGGDFLGFHKVDDEGTVFSSSVTVRLEEIGFRDILPCSREGDGPEHSATTNCLELEVDVFGATRVLVVNDVSDEEAEQLLGRHLESLEEKCVEEQRRSNELRMLNQLLPEAAVSPRGEDLVIDDSVPDASAESIAVTAKKLMHDFPEESIISGQHQIVVDVLEAIGLSPDYVGACNPYAEVYLKSASFGRRSLFKKRDVRQTYYVRKTVNPTWNSQSFVFDVPSEAVAATRGYSISVRVRDFRSFRVFGGHVVLGKAQVDLHMLREQKPLVGWFPLAGRTGRRELENPMSHWGRGSIKLKVQWVYTIPALLEYFLLLSETRFLDLQRSHEGMNLQLNNKKEDIERMKEEMDRFTTVRVTDLLAAQKKPDRRKKAKPAAIFRDTMAAPFRTGKLMAVELRRESSEGDTNGPKKVGFHPHAKRVAHLHKGVSGKVPQFEFEERITKQRQKFQKIISTKAQGERKPNLVVHPEYSGAFTISSFNSWVEVQAVSNDKDMEIEVDGDGDAIKIRLRSQSRGSSGESLDLNSKNVVLEKLNPPLSMPSMFANSANQYASTFVVARNSFERAARRALKAVLNPGGWLTVRPITALNLPDTYSGMYVRLRYGEESLSSETVDSKVYPTWYKGSAEELAWQYLNDDPNDLHVHVAPQKTSGSIRLSVIGERKHQRIKTKTELGVLHIPLGSAITTCIDCSEDSFDSSSDDSPPPSMYVRWFPLTSPKDAVPVEGDRGLSLRPPESEKTSDHLFREYFAPCIQLALIWWPDSDNSEEIGPRDKEGYTARRGESGHGQDHAPLQLTEQATPSRAVESYFMADIGQVSAALISSQRAFEILSFTTSDIDVRYWVTKAKTRMGISIGWLQVDNQAEDAREPIILAPTPNDSISTVLQVLSIKDNIRSKSDVLSFQFIDVSIAEFDVTVEEHLLFELFDFLSSVRLRRGFKMKAERVREDEPDIAGMHEQRSLLTETTKSQEPALLALIFEEGTAAGGDRKVYIEQLFLGVVKFNLSYLKGKKQVWNPLGEGGVVEKRIQGIKDLPRVAFSYGEKISSLDSVKALPKIARTYGEQLASLESPDIFQSWCQHTYDEDRWAEDMEHGSQKNTATLVASLFPNVSDAPVRLQGKALNHVFERPSEIFHSIQKYYVKETLRQIYKIVGSLEFVGNPTMLFTSVFSGVKDFVTAPSTAFLRSPTDPSRLGMGVAKGTLSLFSHSASGFFGFASKVSAAAGQSVAALSLDPEYRIWHRDQIVTEASNLNREWKRRGLQSAGAMITRPLADIIFGIGAGVFGIVASPVKEYKRGGQLGLLRGIAMGGAGAVAKPLVGLLDAMAHFAGSIHDIAKSVNVMEKRYQPAIKYRLPYTFGIMHILMPFDADFARAATILKKFPMRKPRGASAPSVAETLVHVEVLPNFGIDTYAIITSHRLLIIRVKKEASGTLTPSLCWQVTHAGDSVVSSRISDHGHNGVALTITLTKPSEEEEEEEEAAAANETQSQPADKRFVVQEGDEMDELLELESPETGMEFERVTEEFEHGTGRGKEGELLEWFAVVTEYQYRRQLSRIHNVLSCLVGDFNAILNDPSLGRQGCTEGYTSFGIFCFEPVGSEENTEKTKMWQTLERQSRRSVGIAADHENEEKQYPDWLSGAIGETPELWPQTPLLEDTMADSSRGMESVNGRLVRQPTQSTVYLSTLNESERTRTSGLTLSNFYSAREGTDLELGDDNRSERELELVPTCEDANHVGPVDTAALEPPPSPGSQATSMPPPSTATEDSQTPADVEGSSERSEAPTPHPEPPSLAQERLDRMESLMEGLLIFTSERTLEQERTRVRNDGQSTSRGGADTDLTESLRHEIAELNAQLARQTQQEAASYEAIVGLRAEIAELRSQMTSGFAARSNTGEGFESASSQGSAPNEDLGSIEGID